MDNTNKPDKNRRKEDNTNSQSDAKKTSLKEIGGPKGPEPTRYGDWEKKGRCIDF
jgi:hypothetical protein